VLGGGVNSSFENLSSTRFNHFPTDYITLKQAEQERRAAVGKIGLMEAQRLSPYNYVRQTKEK